MLTDIHIRDFAIIDELELELEKGFCALTGETGAGKSIIVDALGLVLGERADTNAIKHGAKRAEISLGIDISNHKEARQWLHEHDLDRGERCVLRRVLPQTGPSKAYINDAPATLTVLKSLAEMLVDIHGQHEHQSLMRRDMQRQLLDSYANNDKHLEKLATLYRTWQGINMKLQSLQASDSERRSRTELLRYQVEELEALSLGETELDDLAGEHQRLANVEQLKSGCLDAYMTLYEREDNSLYSQLGNVIAQLDELHNMDDLIGEYHDLLVETQLQMQEAAHGVHRHGEKLEHDHLRLEWIDSRITAIHDLARKHNVQAQDLPECLDRLQRELKSMEDPQFDLGAVRTQMKDTEIAYRKLAGTIHKSRVAAANRLNPAVTQAMQGIGMAGGRFHIDVNSRGDELSPTGLDNIEFRVSANPGQPLKPLNKVASGGELSRVSLGIQMHAANSMSIPTLIFDEVDSGIGGSIAEMVGRQLNTLGKQRQVLCVTHLPQVAAQADHHYQVTKQQKRNKTITGIRRLDMQERKTEIARMLGGMEMTENTLSHAAEMIARAQTN